MRRVMVRYRVKPEQVQLNEQLVQAVYEELRRREPQGLRYATSRLDDGVTYVHIAETADGANPLAELSAFREFTSDIEARCDEPPVVSTLNSVAAFHLFEDN